MGKAIGRWLWCGDEVNVYQISSELLFVRYARTSNSTCYENLRSQKFASLNNNVSYPESSTGNRKRYAADVDLFKLTT